MDEKQMDWPFTEDDLEWHHRVKQAIVDTGVATHGCEEVVSINRFVSLKALFQERSSAVNWAVRNIPFKAWSDDDLIALAEVSTDNYVVLVARAALDGSLRREEAETRIGIAIIAAVEKNEGSKKDVDSE